MRLRFGIISGRSHANMRGQIAVSFKIAQEQGEYGNLKRYSLWGLMKIAAKDKIGE